MRLLPLLVLALLALPARAQECREFPVKVSVKCTATLLGQGGLTKTLEAWTKTTPLSLRVAGEKAVVKLGTFVLQAGLICSTGQQDPKQSYALDVQLFEKGHSTSPVRLATLRNLNLDERAGKPPLRVESYYFFEKPLSLEDVPVTFTRLDYSCALEAN